MVDRQKIVLLLKTVRGQLDGLIKMIEQERDCVEISTQLLASQSILKRVNLEILCGHLSHCLKESIQKNENIEENIQEMIVLLQKMMK